MLLVDLLDGGSRAGAGSGSGTASSRCARHASGHTTRHAAWHTTGSSARSLIQLGDDGVADSLHLLLLLIELLDLGELVGVQPLDGLIDGLVQLLLVLRQEVVGAAAAPVHDRLDNSHMTYDTALACLNNLF